MASVSLEEGWEVEISGDAASSFLNRPSLSPFKGLRVCELPCLETDQRATTPSLWFKSDFFSSPNLKLFGWYKSNWTFEGSSSISVLGTPYQLAYCRDLCGSDYWSSLLAVTVAVPTMSLRIKSATWPLLHKNAIVSLSENPTNKERTRNCSWPF